MSYRGENGDIMRKLIALLVIICTTQVFANSMTDYLYSMVEGMEGKYEGEYGVLSKKTCYLTVELLERKGLESDVEFKIYGVQDRSQSLSIKLAEFAKLADESREAKVLYKLGDFTLIFNDDLSPSVFKYMREDAIFFWEKLRCRDLRKI